jgi:hypothetical protein
MYAVQTNIEHLYHKILPQLTNEIAQLGKVIKSLNSTIGQQSNKIKDIENEIDLLEVDSDGLSHLAQRFESIDYQFKDLNATIANLNDTINVLANNVSAKLDADTYIEHINTTNNLINEIGDVNSRLISLSTGFDNHNSAISQQFVEVNNRIDSKAEQTVVDQLSTDIINKADKSETESLRSAMNEVSIVQEQRNRMLQIFPTPKEECYGYYDDSTGEFVCKNSDDGNIKKAEILCITSVRKNNGLWKSYCESLNNLTEDETPMLRTLIFAGDDFVMNDIIYYAAASIPRYIETLTEIHVNIRFGKTAAYSTDIGMFYDLLCLRSALEAQSQGYQKIKVFIHKYAGSLSATIQDRYFSNLKTLFWLQSASTIEEITSSTTSQYHGVEWSFEVVNH